MGGIYIIEVIQEDINRWRGAGGRKWMEGAEGNTDKWVVEGENLDGLEGVTMDGKCKIIWGKILLENEG